MEIFYPSSAQAYRAATTAGCVRHSLRKWLGLRPEVLELFNLRWKAERLDSSVVFIPEKKKAGVFYVTSYSCALCVTFPGCEGCPLFRQLGGSCSLDLGGPRVFDVFYATGNPEPMIDQLKILARKYKVSVKKMEAEIAMALGKIHQRRIVR